MVRRVCYLVVVGTLLMLAMPAYGQHGHDHPRDYGVISMDGADAREAGLGSISLRREGPQDKRDEWVITADALDVDGQPLGVFEVRYPSKDPSKEIKEMTFVSADGADVVHIRTDAAAMTYEFEHEGGDSYRINVPVCDQTTLGKLPFNPSQEEQDVHYARVMECSAQMVPIGTEKTFEQLAADNQRFVILSIVEAKIQEVLKREQASTTGGGGGVGIGSLELLTAPPQSELWSTCPPYNQFCGIGSAHPVVAGDGFSFTGNITACCSKASRDADINCQINSQDVGFRDCCANSLCRATSLGGCNGFIPCYCKLIGYMWQCCD